MQGTEPPTPEQAQLAQFEMESRIRQTQLEIAKLEAEVKTLESTAQLNMAKAQGEASEPQLKVADLQSKIQLKQEELELRERLAGMTNEVRRGQTETQAAAKLATAAMKPTGGNKDGEK
jgi:multidrug resistance efflux pump